MSAAPAPTFVSDHLVDDDAAFAALLDKIARERDFQCGSYKERCLRRRIGTRMRARGVHTYDDYAALLDVDGAEYDRLVDALTINVTKLFRNWEAWDALAEHALPEVWALPGDPIRAWSAGSASGEEAYSLAALLHRHAAAHGDPRRPRGVQVVGTDIDGGSLAAAERGVYAAASFADTPDDLRDRYFDGGLPATVRPEVRALVRFERNDLLREAAPDGPWHLVSCRNVLIYFDRDAQEAILRRFANALVPGGVLFLGKVETLLGPVRTAFAPIDQRERIYRRLPAP